MRGLWRQLRSRDRRLWRRLHALPAGRPDGEVPERGRRMMHARRWCVSAVESPEVLAEMLTGRTMTLCSAFFVAGHPNYLFLNDATCEDGAAEFAVVLLLPDGTYRQ